MSLRAALVAALHAPACSVVVGCAVGRVHGSGAPDAAREAPAPPTAASDAGIRDATPGDIAGQREAGGDADAFVRAGLSDAANRVDASGPFACADAAAALPARARCVLRIDGRAIDESDAPVAPHTLASACGPAACSPGFTGSDGAFAIPVGFHLDPGVYSVQMHVRPDRAAFYFALPGDALGPVVDMGALRVLDMPAHGPLLDVDRSGAPSQTVTSGDVTLEVPEGVYVRLDVESNLAGDHGREFRALTIAPRFIDEFSDGMTGVQAMYALEPFESSFEYPASGATPALVRLSFANTAGLEAGAGVDVLALGTYIYPGWVKPAAFEKVASGHVSADGSKIELDPGEGLSHLTWIAIREA